MSVSHGVSKKHAKKRKEAKSGSKCNTQHAAAARAGKAHHPLCAHAAVFLLQAWLLGRRGFLSLARARARAGVAGCRLRLTSESQPRHCGTMASWLMAGLVVDP